MPTADQIRRVRFARLLVHQAADHARVDYDARSAACITSLQDAVETVLLVIADHVNAPLGPRPDFDKYFQQINAVTNQRLPLQNALSRLNRMRVQAKHSGIFPSYQQVKEMMPIVSEFMTEVCQSHLGISWASANLGALIQNVQQRYFIEEAELALNEKRFVDALISSRKALFLAFEKASDIGRFNTTKPLGPLETWGCEAPTWAQSYSYITEKVGDPFGLIVLDHSALDAKLVKLGIDPMTFWNVWRITPAVYQLGNGKWIVKNELQKVERPVEESDAIYAVENITEIVLRKESHEARLKVLPYAGQFELKVLPGAVVFSKAAALSDQRHTFSGGESVIVHARTYGFAGEDGWWEMFWRGPSSYIVGYLHETHVDRTVDTAA